MTRLILAVCVMLGCSDSARPAETETRDLHDEFDTGRVAILSVAGNGKSSGHSITAILVTSTRSTSQINVNLVRPIYFANTGRGQNMVALQVYLPNGGYKSDGRQSFIPLAPNSRTPVVFVAFCIDFDKDNPTERDRFSVGLLSPALSPVIKNISEYLAANPDTDVVSAAQAAIWLAQGIKIQDIRSRFTVTASEEELARRFITRAVRR